jgi:L-rhamnose-H+ transport protein
MRQSRTVCSQDVPTHYFDNHGKRGVLLHAVGGLAAGSFYLPFKRVRRWSWESYWLVGGLLMWGICPLIAAVVTIPELLNTLQLDKQASLITLLCGMGWGCGHITFGLSIRYLGISLGTGLSLGFCTFFGSLMPTLVKGTFFTLLAAPAGQFALAGLAICLVGIVLTAWAGMSKENEVSEEIKKEGVEEFQFFRGVSVALFAGVMSACFAFGIEFGQPLQELAVTEGGADPIYANNAPLLLILWGGGLMNFLFCITLNLRNGSVSDYVDREKPLANNYIFCILVGLIAYSEFLFFGMGETQMGRFSVLASYPIHMAFIIAFSNMWGILLHEWRGTSGRTRGLLALGLLFLLGSTILSAYGSYQLTLLN